MSVQTALCFYPGLVEMQHEKIKELFRIIYSDYVMPWLSKFTEHLRVIALLKGY